MDEDTLKTVVKIAEDHEIDGYTATNTTVNRSNLSLSDMEKQAIGPGGLSGAPLHERAVEVVRRIRTLTAKPIIGLGGIRNADHARNFLSAGANLVQMYTGFVYEGPGVIKKICRQLQDDD